MKFPHHRFADIRDASGRTVFGESQKLTYRQVTAEGYCSFVDFSLPDPGFTCADRRGWLNFCKLHEKIDLRRRQTGQYRHRVAEPEAPADPPRDSSVRLVRPAVAAPWAPAGPAPQPTTAAELRRLQQALLEQCVADGRVRLHVELPPLRTTDFFSIAREGDCVCVGCDLRRPNVEVRPCGHLVCLFCVHQLQEAEDLRCPECSGPVLGVEEF